jgi:hypothetical protein
MGTVSDSKITKRRKAPAGTDTDGQFDVVRGYANQVTDETHWAQILAAAPSDEVRVELERTVGPLLRFRRAAPCSTASCQSLLPAVWQPVFVVHCTASDEPIWAPLEVHYCDTCKQEIRLADVMTDEVWGQILTKCQATGDNPRRWLTELMWDRIH